MPDASPTKWHLAHTTWFFETFALEPFGSYKAFDPAYRFLFNSYYEAVGPRHPRPQRGLLSRPSAMEVLAYRAHVDSAVEALIQECDEAEWRLLRPVIELGLHHEQQHQELILMDIKHAFSLNPLWPEYLTSNGRRSTQAVPLTWMSLPGGLYEIGHRGDDFAFDNEAPRHRVWLEPFRIASRLTTNGEFCQFIADDGYSRPEFWLSDGWAACVEEAWRGPLYWLTEESDRKIFTLNGLQDLDPAEPVCHVSYYEADAYARWAGKRLLSEVEWEVAASRAPPEELVDDRIGAASEVRDRVHPSPAQTGDLAQLFGECWQWTRSAYDAYPGYRTPAGAIGEYNAKFMANQFVLRGSAAVTARGHARTTYRNFFPPAARWAFSGIRLADDHV